MNKHAHSNDFPVVSEPAKNKSERRTSNCGSEKLAAESFSPANKKASITSLTLLGSKII